MQAITNPPSQELRVPQITLGLRLKLARESADLSQYELADAIGISARSVQNYERSNTTPKRPALLSWALATGVPLAWLTEGEIDATTRCPSCGRPEDPEQTDQGEPPMEPRSRCFCVNCLAGNPKSCETVTPSATIYRVQFPASP